MMRAPKHLPVQAWPEADVQAFDWAYRRGDILDETAGSGSHLAEGTRRIIRTAYRRWLGFLAAEYPEELLRPPTDRITLERIRAFAERLAGEVRPRTIALNIMNLCYPAQLIGTKGDWQWLSALGSRLAARASPEDRFNRLVPGAHTLNLGLELMEAAFNLPSDSTKARERQYRDGLIIALISLWPIRRRSIAALTVDRHLVFDDAGLSIVLHPADTKSKRAESVRVAQELVPYVQRYVDDVRPRLLIAGKNHWGLWASLKGGSLTGGRIYDVVRARIRETFGKDMSLHDFRRSAATFTAMDAPENLGLIPGLLHHTKPEVSEQHYNLAGSMKASERYNTTMLNLRTALRSNLKPAR